MDVKSHLKECESCEKELEELEEIRLQIKSLDEVDTPENFTPSVMAKIRKKVKLPVFSIPSVVYSFVFIVFFILGFFINGHTEKNDFGKQEKVNLSNIFLESQNLSLIIVQEDTMKIIGEGEADER